MSSVEVPATIFTGFLGSGKTTIISHLIDELQASDSQVIYIKNEIGSENIDAELLKGKHIQTKELLNGCICCTLVGPFVQAINEIITTFKPERIIIEASGAADPAALAMMVDSHPNLKRDGVLAVVDVVNFQGYKDLSITAQNQTKFTDIIVFNKVELVSLERKKTVVGYVRELNYHSPIIEAPQGKLPAEVVFGISSPELSTLLQQAGFHQDQHNHPHAHHLEQDGLVSSTLIIDSSIDISRLEEFIQKLPPSIYRVKGIITSPQGTYIINKVGTRLQFEPKTQSEHQNARNVLVLIGFHIESQLDGIKQQLELLTQNQAS